MKLRLSGGLLLIGIVIAAVIAQAYEVTHSQVQARFDLGQSEAKAGKDEEALKQYVWCYDVGMKAPSSYEGVRNSFLLGAWSDLAQHYPPAHDALVQRRDAALAKISADPKETGSAQDFAALNKSLGEDANTLAYYNKLPIDSPQRSMMGYDVFDLLLEKQQYKDAARAMPYEEFRELFSETTKLDPRIPVDAETPIKSHETRFAAREIEALAGAGQLKEAKELIDLVLKYNSSSEAKAVIHDHLARAGQPDLLK